MNKERLFDQLRRIVENLKPQNRIGVVAKITIDDDYPQYTRVLIDRGERDVNAHGVGHEFKKAIIPTKKVLQEGWAMLDIVCLGYRGKITRIASFQELKESGADLDKIYSKFIDWASFNEKVKARQEREQLRFGIAPDGP